MKNYRVTFRLVATTILATLLQAIVSDIKAQVPDDTTYAEVPEKSFSFVYIAQGNAEEMPMQDLERKLETSWSAIQQGPVIFYLSRGIDSPVILLANMDDSADLEEDRKKFEEILTSLREGIEYSVDGAHDKRRILDILRQNDFVDKRGIPVYRSVTFEFHVGQDFWNFGNNEIVIASLFFELNIGQYMKYGYDFHYNVFCPRKLTWNEADGPFGIFNPDECRKYINLDRSY